MSGADAAAAPSDPIAGERAGDWREMPGPGGGSTRPSAVRSAALALLVGWLVAGLGPAWHTRAITVAPRAWMVAVGAAVGVVALGALRRARGSTVLLVTAAAVAAAAVLTSAWAGGRWVGLWVAVGLGLVWLGVPSVPGAAHRGTSSQVAVVAGLAACWAGRPASSTWQPVLLLVCAAPLVHLSVAHPGPVRTVDRWIRATFVRLGAVVRTGAFALVGALVVLVPWALQRLVRWDPTWSAPRGHSRWVARARTGPATGRPWNPDAARPTSPGRRAHRWAIRGGALVLAVLVVLGGTARWGPGAPSPVADAPAMAGAPWWPDLNASTDALHRHLVLNTLDTQQLPDTTSEHLNVVDGRRRTWSPPPGDCRPLRVWMFGGSAMFGEGQRDHRTIASQLARLAHRQGIDLQVENFGVPGDVQFTEARRLESRLASGEDPPDLVVFYDGYNDVAVRHALNQDAARANDELGASWVDATFYEWTQRYLEPLQRRLERERSSVSFPSEPVAQVDADTVAARAVRQYLLGQDSARRTLDAEGLTGVWFLQPDLYTRVRPVPGEPVPADATFARIVERFRTALSDRVVDLGSAVDPVGEPVYYDDVHTNELGADAAAAAVLASLGPQLARLCADRGGATCC